MLSDFCTIARAASLYIHTSSHRAGCPGRGHSALECCSWFETASESIDVHRSREDRAHTILGRFVLSMVDWYIADCSCGLTPIGTRSGTVWRSLTAKMVQVTKGRRQSFASRGLVEVRYLMLFMSCHLQLSYPAESEGLFKQHAAPWACLERYPVEPVPVKFWEE